MDDDDDDEDVPKSNVGNFAFFFYQLYMTIRQLQNWMSTIIERKKANSVPKSCKNRQSDGTITKYQVSAEKPAKKMLLKLTGKTDDIEHIQGRI